MLRLPRKMMRLLAIRGKSKQRTSLDARTSSFPFVSGDTFRLFAGFEVGAQTIERRSRLDQNTVFSAVSVVTKPTFLEDFLRYQQQNSWFRPGCLLVHGGDKPPDCDSLERIAQEARVSVYCVNVVEETNRVRALPIGLENAVLNTNGRMKHYINDLQIPGREARNKRVLSSFHVETNPALRGPLAEKMAKSRHGFDGVRWKLGEYRQQLRETLFVVSPPGNGFDCHRTWEAMALGAVPVVLESAIAASLSREMPMMVVPSYDDFIAMDDSELDAWFERLSQRTPYALMAAYWTKKLS